MWTGSLHRQQDVYLLLSIHRPLSFIHTHIRHIWFPLRVENMILECLELGVPLLSLSSSALPSGAAVLCRLELGWGELASGPVQFLCPVLTECWGSETDLRVFPVIKQFYLAMLKSFTWILQLCHDGAGKVHLAINSSCSLGNLCRLLHGLRIAQIPVTKTDRPDGSPEIWLSEVRQGYWLECKVSVFGSFRE